MMLYSIKVIIYILLLSIHPYLHAQKEELPSKSKKPFAERLFLGGSLGLSFGSYSSLVDVSPILGYAVTDDFMTGIGLTYKYYKYNDYYWDDDNKTFTDLKMNIYGGSIWARYFLTKTEIPIIENTFLHLEIEPLFINHSFRFDPSRGSFYDPFGGRYSKESERISITGIFAGGGLRQSIGGRSFMYLEVLWNLNEELYSPYSNPRIRVGVAVGF